MFPFTPTVHPQREGLSFTEFLGIFLTVSFSRSFVNIMITHCDAQIPIIFHLYNVCNTKPSCILVHSTACRRMRSAYGTRKFFQRYICSSTVVRRGHAPNVGEVGEVVASHGVPLFVSTTYRLPSTTSTATYQWQRPPRVDREQAHEQNQNQKQSVLSLSLLKKGLSRTRSVSSWLSGINFTHSSADSD